MTSVDYELCEQFGLDPKRVLSIARRLSRAAVEARQMGMFVFGGSGDGSLRVTAAEIQGPGFSDVADLDGTFDGGDGGDIYSGALGESELLRSHRRVTARRAEKGGEG